MKRVIYSDNGTLKDFSSFLNRYSTGKHEFNFVASEDAFFIGADLPFNHFFLKIGDYGNDNVTAMTVQLWSGSEWKDVIELIDETSLDGISLNQNGFVSFVPDRDESWAKDDTKYSSSQITGLEDIVIYDMFWLKITFDNDFSTGAEIAFVGNKFSDDNDLKAEFPSLMDSELMSAWESGKTSWEEQEVKAAELLIMDLKNKRLILDENQILDKNDLSLASVYKTAELIYNGSGREYEEDVKKNQVEYYKRLNKSFPKIDANENARVDYTERVRATMSGGLTRR